MPGLSPLWWWLVGRPAIAHLALYLLELVRGVINEELRAAYTSFYFTSDIISVSATKAGGGFNAGDLVSTQMVFKGFSVAVKALYVKKARIQH